MTEPMPDPSPTLNDLAEAMRLPVPPQPGPLTGGLITPQNGGGLRPAEQADARHPQVCSKCRQWCVYDGWDHVHGNGLGIGSCVAQTSADTDTLRAQMLAVAHDLALHTVKPDNDRDEGFIVGLDHAARRIRAALEASKRADR